jgi:hypothetical protein
MLMNTTLKLGLVLLAAHAFACGGEDRRVGSLPEEREDAGTSSTIRRKDAGADETTGSNNSQSTDGGTPSGRVELRNLSINLVAIDVINGGQYVQEEFEASFVLSNGTSMRVAELTRFELSVPRDNSRAVYAGLHCEAPSIAPWPGSDTGIVHVRLIWKDYADPAREDGAELVLPENCNGGSSAWTPGPHPVVPAEATFEVRGLLEDAAPFAAASISTIQDAR